MLISLNRLINTPILSVQASGPIATVSEPIVDPDSLKIIGFVLKGPLVDHSDAKIIDIKSIREYSPYGMVIDSADELVAPDDVIRISEILKLNFNLISLKVETKKGTKLGHVIDYTLTDNDFVIQQIIVKRPLAKSFLDPELTIPRTEIVEITDYKVIVKDEEKTIKSRSTHEDFIPNFVNPFRNQGQEFAPAQTKNPDDKDTE